MKFPELKFQTDAEPKSLTLEMLDKAMEKIQNEPVRDEIIIGCPQCDRILISTVPVSRKELCICDQRPKL